MQMNQRMLFLLLLFLNTSLISFAQTKSNDSLSKVVKAIAKSDVYEVSYTIGFAGTLSKQYQRFEQLLSIATEDQLLDLVAHHKNAVVRIYAFQALKRKKIKIPETLFQQFLDDTTQVESIKGCIGDKRSVSGLAEQNLQSPYDFSN